MQIETLLTPRRTRCGLEGGSKKRALELLAKTIADDIPTIDADDLFRRLVNRERLGSTGLGKGIAIPHCRIDNCTGPIGAMITLAQPIDFDAIDGEPVSVLFALLVPEDAHDDHLKALATLANAFNDQEFRQRLKQSESDDALYNIIIQTPEMA